LGHQVADFLLRARIFVLRWLARFRPYKTLGRRGEDAAARYLKRRGYKIVSRGQREGRSEIDLIAVDGRIVVFVEVKTLASSDPGHPAEAVTPDKQRALTRGALAYLKRHGLLEYSTRFDVVAVTWSAKKPLIQHYQNAHCAAEVNHGLKSAFLHDGIILID
jgi:putative endonuclease